MPPKSIKRRAEVSTSRNPRVYNSYEKYIKLKNGRQEIVAHANNKYIYVFHTYMEGHILMRLCPKTGEPVCAWRDKIGIFSIRSYHIGPQNFIEHVINAEKIFINGDAFLLLQKNAALSQHLILYTGSLLETLDSIKQQCAGIGNIDGTSDTSQNTTPSYAFLKSLDSSLTLKEYNKMYH